MCVSVRCVRDSRLEGEGDVVASLLQVGICEGVCGSREVSPLHQLRHAQMLLAHAPTVTLTTQLARPVSSRLLLLLLLRDCKQITDEYTT